MNQNPYESPATAEPPTTLVVEALLTCAHCGGGHSETGTDGPVAKDVFGFREFECRKCRNITTVPLSNSYLACYWAFAAGCGCMAAINIANGVVPVLPLFAVIMPAHALNKNRTVVNTNAALTKSWSGKKQ